MVDWGRSVGEGGRRRIGVRRFNGVVFFRNSFKVNAIMKLLIIIVYQNTIYRH
jgi:hypothetical protein